MKLISRLACPIFLMLCLGSPTWAAEPAASVPLSNKPPYPHLALPDRQAGGQRAIDLLGSRLPEVASWYGKSPGEFKALLLKDRRMRIDQRGRVFVIEELDQPLPATQASAANSGLLDGTLAPLNQTFLLHSRPSAKRTIYLNFKGATLTGTAWNGSGSISALPFDLDGLPYSNSTAELQRIQYIWQRVAEDYAPFDVDVTTEAVALDRLTRSGSADDVFGTTVLITSRTGVYSCSCGGVAYLGVFDDTSDHYKPALVFFDALGSGNEKYVAEAISHEVGHHMGLAHDGTSTVGYYRGHGSGATGWAPIMGVGYYQALVHWSKGQYADANNVQDDYVVMQSNGLPLRPDDHGNTLAAGTALVGTSSGGASTASVQGVIERPGDIDVFTFAAAAGSATFSLSPAARSANLDALVTLRDTAGNVLARSNPADTLNATIGTELPAAGTYYLAVQGTGKGDPLTTGYSNYGSLGQYTLNASFSTAGSQAPVAGITASMLRGTAPLTVVFSGTNSRDPDGKLIAYEWSFGDTGTASGATTSHSYTMPGSYGAQLRVTDNSGLSDSTGVTITVDAPAVVPAMRVADIAMGLIVALNGNSQASAAVKVLSSGGLPVAGASVTGNWSGLVTHTGIPATTDSAGVARFTSPTSLKGSGTFVFTVTDVRFSGYTYAPLSNTETSDSIAR